MPNPSAPTVLDSRRVGRRRFLRAAAGGAAGLAGVLATGRLPAIAQTRELTFLTFASFVPATDKELRRQFEAWGARNKVKGRLAIIPGPQYKTMKATAGHTHS